MLDLQDYIRDIHDFPKPGVLFKDITPLLNNREASKECLRQLLEKIGDQKIDKVVGIDARGFFFGTLLADALGAGFVPVRKAGKLPFETHKEPYLLEYGMDAIEIHEDAIVPGERVLIHDDVLATGGTARAACNLVKKCGGEVVQCNFIMQLTFLNGKEKIRQYDVASLMDF